MISFVQKDRIYRFHYVTQHQELVYTAKNLMLFLPIDSDDINVLEENTVWRREGNATGNDETGRPEGIDNLYHISTGKTTFVPFHRPITAEEIAILATFWVDFVSQWIQAWDVFDQEQTVLPKPLSWHH